MKLLRSLQRKMFDIRPGEHVRTWAMFFYLLFVLFAYYIVKPVSRAMFLNKFDIDRLPALYILIAALGGVLAYLYSKLAARTSLRIAVFWTMAISVACLVAMWALIHIPWMVYALNVWVSLFSIVLVSQGWLVASNIFDTRQAKRVYPLLGMGMVLGAAFGGEFTNRTAMVIGTRNLLLACAVMVIFAYAAFRVAVSQARGSVAQARAAEAARTDFSFGEIARDVRRTRHLQVIVGIMIMMYLVDTVVEYQFQATAKAGYSGDQLTAFFGHFYGLYLNAAEIVFQLVVTAAVVRHFGVGGTLQVSPIAIFLSSFVTVALPGLGATSAVRLTEATTRYTLNRTGMELLYLPLPLELRNRIKAFIDICVDRLARGLGGLLLLVLTATSIDMGIKGLAVVTTILCIPWIWFCHLARKEYIATIRKRFEARRLEFETTRVQVHDAATVRFLEETAQSGQPRQAAYAIGLLAEAPGYDARRLFDSLADHPSVEVRDKVYEVAAAGDFSGLLKKATGEVRFAEGAPDRPFAPAAVCYVMKMDPEPERLAAELLEAPNPKVVAAALDALRTLPELAQELISREWLDRMASSQDASRRALAAQAVGARGDQGTEVLHRLLEDPDPVVAGAAAAAAGALKNRSYLYPLIRSLANPKLRRDGIAALSQYGPGICGALADVLLDESAPMRIRRQIPRVLKYIPHQRSVDALISLVGHPDISLRSAALKALNRLRDAVPELKFDDVFVTDHILKEARYYYELNAALAPFRQKQAHERSAARLLARTIEERLNNTLERLFRLLGLRYPPREIYSAYLAFSSKKHEAATAALEFLDTILERDLKRILLPLFDAPEHLLEHGREFFGVEVRSAEDAIRELIRSQDPWLVACSVAAAAELQLRGLVPDIARAAEESHGEVSEVARSAEAQLAAA
jgi:HEAT repeat protein